MKLKTTLFGSLCLIICSSCATSGQTTLLGLGIGTLAGGTIGIIADGGPRGRLRTRNSFIGTTFGGAIGAGIAYLIHKEPQKVQEKTDIMSEKKTMELFKPQYSGTPGEPTLLQPRVETRYIDDQIRGNVFVPGHLEYQIAEPAQWRKE